MSYISVAQYASSEDTKKTAPYDESSLFCIMVLTLSAYNSPTWCYAYPSHTQLRTRYARGVPQVRRHV